MSANDIFSGKGFDTSCAKNTDCSTALNCHGGRCTCPSSHYRLFDQDIICRKSKWLVKSDQKFMET